MKVPGLLGVLLVGLLAGCGGGSLPGPTGRSLPAPTDSRTASGAPVRPTGSPPPPRLTHTPTKAPTKAPTASRTAFRTLSPTLSPTEVVLDDAQQDYMLLLGAIQPPLDHRFADDYRMSIRYGTEVCRQVASGTIAANDTAGLIVSVQTIFVLPDHPHRKFTSTQADQVLSAIRKELCP